jgi:uncharacterized radical SAM superfamily Fe-S cluster-containing enzyme
MKKLEDTYSICATCFKEGMMNNIPAEIIEENNKVYMLKKCKIHGISKEIYFDDFKLYDRWMKYKVTGNDNPHVKTQILNYPELYDIHKSQNVLIDLLVTNRCNEKCNYYPMNAETVGYVYEPTIEKLKSLMSKVRNAKNNTSNSIQITGGEPTIREDLIDIVKAAKEIGFSHVQIKTNGIKLAESIELCQRLKDAKVNTIYMNFDGVTKDTNPWIEKNKKAIENLRKVNLKCVLVPVLINGKNLHQTGKIIRFAVENKDIVRGIIFQPISFCGPLFKTKDEVRDKKRVSHVKLIEEIEKEFNGGISRDDFYPIPFLFPASKIIKMLKGNSPTEFTAHPLCGCATYLFVDEDGRAIPFTRFGDAEGFIDLIDRLGDIKGPLKKIRIASAFIKNIDNFIDYEKAPYDINFKKTFKNAILGNRLNEIRRLRNKIIFISSICFQDPFNLNIDRLQRCIIHCPTFEGAVPYCAYNGLDIGETIMKKYSTPLDDWKNGTVKKQE